MRILVASDSFKDGCSSIDACKAIANGIQAVKPESNIEICPISDGGEGAVEVLQYHLGGDLIELAVSNPLFKRVKAHYLHMKNGTAFIEMAQASGLELLTTRERNPLNNSTFGTGELIKDACHRGCKDIIISVGGSATNDLGIGMASALGWQFLDSSGISVVPIGFNLDRVVKIDSSQVDKRIASVRFTVITDVHNPLTGFNGAAYVYGRQKGADDQSIEHLERGIRHLWDLLTEQKSGLTNGAPGYGAAGGLGAGCVAFLNSDISSGFSIISELINIQDKIDHADIIISGEGHLDHQSVDGKVISGISKMAKGKKLVVLCGKNSLKQKDRQQLGIHQILEISDSKIPLESALSQTVKNLENCTRSWAKDNL